MVTVVFDKQRLHSILIFDFSLSTWNVHILKDMYLLLVLPACSPWDSLYNAGTVSSFQSDVRTEVRWHLLLFVVNFTTGTDVSPVQIIEGFGELK
jgi:hypothetical protein